MQLIILAAGRGSRLPKKFRNKPKCLAEVNKKPLIIQNSISMKVKCTLFQDIIIKVIILLFFSANPR